MRSSNFIDMFGEAYTAGLAASIDVVRTEGSPVVSGVDGASDLAVAPAAIETAERGAPIRVAGIG